MKHSLVFGFAFLMSSLVVADQVNAVEVHVPDDHATIQAAVDAAKPFDVVVVSPGTYKERVVLKAGIKLKSAGGNEKGKLGLKRAEATVIDGGGEEGEGPGVAMAEGGNARRIHGDERWDVRRRILEQTFQDAGRRAGS